MNIFTLLRLGLIALAAFALGQIVFASAAANSIPPTQLDSISRSVEFHELAPAGCGAQDLEQLITGSGTLTGTSGNDLILGSAGDDTIDGLGGDDCIVGGGGDDTLIGGEGSDSCIGGPGANTLDISCEE